MAEGGLAPVSESLDQAIRARLGGFCDNECERTLTVALTAVLDRHQPVEMSEYERSAGRYGHHGLLSCPACENAGDQPWPRPSFTRHVWWPCPTVRDIALKLGVPIPGE